MQLGKFKRCKYKTLFGHCMVVRLLSKCTEYIDLLKFNNMVLSHTICSGSQFSATESIMSNSLS